MTRFTVEVTVAPVENGDWTLLRSVLDAIPGALLIEDPTEPQLLIPVDADSPMKAATFVEGVAQLMGFETVRGSIYEPEDDFDAPEDDEPSEPTTATITVQGWVNDIPPLRKASGDRELATA